MIRRLLYLNGIAIISVVIFHASGWGFVAMFSWTHRYLPVSSPNYDQLGSLSYFAGRAVEQFVVFSVPAFLFVSGFFIAFATGRTRPNVSWETIISRIKNLIIPYLIWSLIIFLILYLQGITYSPWKYILFLMTGQTNPAYYYVPLLVQFLLLSPILVPIAKKRGWQLLIITFLVQLLVQASYYPDLLGIEIQGLESIGSSIPKWLFLSRIFWFTAGIVVGFNHSVILSFLTRFKWHLIGSVIVLWLIGIFEWEYYLRVSGRQWFEHRETFIDTFYTIAFILSFLVLEEISKIPFTKQLSDLASKSFGIYLIHSPVMEYTARGIYHLVPWILGYQILLQPILILTGLGLPLLLMAVVNRSPARKYYQYLFG